MNRKVLTSPQLSRKLKSLHKKGKKIVFTNGCFDILHAGHIRLLARSKKLGDLLVVGINTDRSVKKLKGPTRPVFNEKERALMLAALEPVDFVTFFGEPTPQKLIDRLQPDVIVKGGDYSPKTVVGAQTIKKNGGKVVIFPLVKGKGTSQIIKKILRSHR